MVRLLAEAGAELNSPLSACASCDNVEAASLLLDFGADINASPGGWSPLEEALYWNSRHMMGLLVQRGASIHNLRIASGLGRIDLMKSFFNEDGVLKPEAGIISWPWGDLEFISRSNFDAAGKQYLSQKYSSWNNDRQGILNNAFVYACMHGHIPASQFLLEEGAQVNAIAGGFDYSGTGLHYAAYNGQRAMVEFLLGEGADGKIKDTKIGETAAGWAQAGNHLDIKEYLEQQATPQQNH